MGTTVNRGVPGWVLVLVLACGTPVPPVAAADAGERKAALERELVARLEELGGWCADNRLFGQREGVAEVILKLSPDHAKARAWGRYVRDKTGAWTRPAQYKPSQDVTNARAAPEGRQRSSAALAPYRDGVLALAAPEAEGVSMAQRERWLADLLALLPGDEKVRAANGETRVGDRWVLVETAARAERRKSTAVKVAELLAEMGEPESTDPTVEEKAAGGKQAVYAVQTAHFRLAGTVPPDQLARIAKRGEALARLEQVWFAPDRPIGTHAMLVFATRAQFEDAIEARTDLKDEEKKAGRRYGAFGGLWQSLWIGYADEPWQVEGVMRGAGEMDLLNMARGALPWSLRVAVARYLTACITGTHLLWDATDGPYAQPGGRENAALLTSLRQSPDWVRETRRRLSLPGATAPDLRLSLGKGPDATTPDDVLLLYSLAAYVFECVPDRAAALVSSQTWRADTPEGRIAFRPIDDAIPLIFGRTLDGLAERLVRWIRESE